MIAPLSLRLFYADNLSISSKRVTLSMFLQSTHRFWQLSSATALLAAIATSTLGPATAVAQTDPTDSQTAIRVPMDNSILSLQGIESLIADATAAISAQDYSLAIRKLQEPGKSAINCPTSIKNSQPTFPELTTASSSGNGIRP